MEADIGNHFSREGYSFANLDENFLTRQFTYTFSSRAK